MRYPVLLVAFVAGFSCAPTVIAAQGRRPPVIGVYGGWVESTVSGDIYMTTPEPPCPPPNCFERNPLIFDPAHANSFVGGAFIVWHLGGGVSVQPEIQYVEKGTKETASGNLTLRVRVQYLEFPLLVRLNGPELGGFLTPYVLGGPEAAFLTTCKLRVSGIVGDYTCAMLPGKRTFDYGLMTGGGADLSLGGHHVTLTLRRDRGLHDAFKWHRPRNHTWLAMLGVPIWGTRRSASCRC